MGTKHGSLSAQTAKRLLGGDLILKGYDNAEIADIVDVSPTAVQQWRKKLKEHSDDLRCLDRKAGSGSQSRLLRLIPANFYTPNLFGALTKPTLYDRLLFVFAGFGQ